MSVAVPAIERVISQIVVDPGSGCWLFQGSTVTGYGQIELNPGPNGQRRSVVAHRFVYEMLRQSVPEGHDLHHKCHVRECCNPSHLEVVDHREHGLTHMPRHPDCRRCGWSDWYVEARTNHRTCRECKRRRRKAQQAKATPEWTP
jgi:hypothetical protein